MADKTKHEQDKPDLGQVVGAALLEFARLGRLTDATYDRLSDEFDPKPEPTDDDQADEHVDSLTADERAELDAFRAARAADTTASTPAKASGTSKGASK